MPPGQPKFGIFIFSRKYVLGGGGGFLDGPTLQVHRLLDFVIRQHYLETCFDYGQGLKRVCGA